ncbi:hypothetical protein F2Q69_00023604 [Brassica cretica]|uniref:Uncharacterized protein n=1 Tax=Brassica cretica TaxID=69181 RepID=A0A8S9QMA3_BRACR|nr:hypothetical protein F2Q69_00023604 [Brassica cretica]
MGHVFKISYHVLRCKWTSRTGFRARPRFTFGSKAVRRLIGSRFACGRFPPGSFRFKVRDLAPAYMTCMERTEHSPETVWSADQNFGFFLVPIQGLLERYACLEIPVLGVSQVNLRLLWLIAIGFSAGRAMDSGIASLSGAVAWASDSGGPACELVWGLHVRLVPIQGLLESFACLETLVLGVSQVNLRLFWLIAIGFSAGKAMDSGIASLSGAVAWASDSESLFVEPSGVL